MFCSNFGGDFLAEIIRDDGIFKKLFVWFGTINPGKPVNLKPLDPDKIAIISTKEGFIKHYEQIMEVKDKYIVIAAISALTIIELYALSKGINGTLMMIIIACIAGLAGWVMPQPHLK